MFRIIIFFTLLILTPMYQVTAEWGVRVESGTVFSGYNDVRIPNKTGTLFSLTDDLKTESKIYYRINLLYDLDEKNHLSLLFAPLSLNANGTAPKDISFDGKLFTQGSHLEARYKFNSYRLTYRRRILDNNRLKIGLGLTAKIRDAAIKVESDSESAENTNVGIVPLVNFRFEMKLSQRISAVLEGDALAAPQGRAEDIFIGCEYSLNRISVNAGYRLLEGGADVDKVYTFAMLHYATLGMTVRFK